MSELLFAKSISKKKPKSKAYVFDGPVRCYIANCTNNPCAHHIVFGDKFLKQLSEQEGLMLPVCNRPHHLQDKNLSIHGNYDICRVVQVKAQMKWMIRECKSENDFKDLFGINFMIHETKARESEWWNKVNFELQRPRR